jgi:hypothetical protein
MTSIYAEHAGPGSVEAARMAIEDFGGSVLGKPIELVFADHRNDPGLGMSIAQRWYGEGVDALADVGNSAVALAVEQISREAKRIVLFSGPASDDLTGPNCSPYAVDWTYDTYAMAHGTANAIVRSGGNSWFHAYPNACQTGLRCLRQAGALIGILVFLVIFSIPILAFWIPSPAKAGFARSAEVINIFNISYTEPIGFFQSIVEIAQRQMHPLFAVSQCLGKCFNLIKMDISTTVPAIFIVDESCSDFLYVRGRFAFVQVNEFNRVFGVHKSVSETKFEGAHSDFRSMCRDEFGVSESNCLGNLASLTNTNNNQSSSYDSENDGKGGDYRISDFDLAPKLIMPFIIFFVGLGVTVCGIFPQIGAKGYVGIIIGASLVFAGPLVALVCMGLWALRLL